ncbi:copper resistance protein B [soil metagenome]
MKTAALIGLLPLMLGAPALAQTMDHSMMPGMQMPAPTAKPVAKKPPAPKPVVKKKAAPRKAAAPRTTAKPAAGRAMGAMAMPSPASGQVADPHAGHDMSTMAMPAAPTGQDMGAMPMPATSADPHAGHDMAAMPMPGMNTDQAMSSMADMGDIPNTPPPAPTDHAADNVFDPTGMAKARAQLRKEHGGGITSLVMANFAEWAPRSGKDSYRWEGEAWFGGDINRLTLKSEGEGLSGDGLNRAELQALYSRSVGPYFNLQAGVRHDFEPRPSRTYATIGFEGLAPYWFEVSGAAFLSNKGDLSARLEGYYDQRLTQRLIIQPRAELNLAASNDRATGVGSGLSDVELGLRLRYEIRREFAPYIGVTYDRKFGRTADYARTGGEDVEDARVVLGLRAWF